MQVVELMHPVNRLGWDTEVVIRINDVEHAVTGWEEGVLSGGRAILIADPEPRHHPRTKDRRVRRGDDE